MTRFRSTLGIACLCLGLGAGNQADASTIVTLLLEDFEDANVAYTLSNGPAADGEAYFTRMGGTGGSTLPGSSDYGTPNGTGGTPSAGGGFFAAQSTNIGEAGLDFDSATMTFSGIDISGAAAGTLQFSGLFSEDDRVTEDWDANTSVRAEASLDGGAFFQIFRIESSNGNDSAPAVDTDFNGTGDGTIISDSFVTFTAAIAGAGNLLSLRIIFENLNGSGKDIAFDDITLTGMTPMPPVIGTPEPSSVMLLGGLALCGGGYHLRRRRRQHASAA
ncbi:MAG: PEP-CTERM sorting domain-containing protein [Planctomycetaceae bacterium]